MTTMTDLVLDVDIYLTLPCSWDECDNKATMRMSALCGLCGRISSLVCGPHYFELRLRLLTAREVLHTTDNGVVPLASIVWTAL